METATGLRERRTEEERRERHRELYGEQQTPSRGTGLGLRAGTLSRQEVREIATACADEVMARVREREHESLMLHSVPSAYGSPGLVVNEAIAMATPCRCIEYRPDKKLCFTKGIVGALSDEQEGIYCPETIPLESPGLERHLEGWMESVGTCKAEIAPIPKGERLEPWLSCMSRELAAHGIEA